MDIFDLNKLVKTTAIFPIHELFQSKHDLI